MTETERIRRVREMERRMHELSAAAEGLQTALAAYEAALPARRALEDYYESPLWQEDFAADEAGLLPADLCRGVLTEDALFDLLGDTDLLHGELTRVAREACARTKFIVRPVMTTKHARRAGGCARTDAVPAPTPAHAIPDPDIVFANEYGTSCSPKKVITAPNITVGD